MRPDANFEARVGPIQYTGAPLDYTTGWYVEEVTGLNSGASATADEQPRDQGEGQHDLPNRLDDARAIGLRGIAYAESMYELGRMARQQGALLALPEESRQFTWLEFGELNTVDVRRGPGWDFRRRGDSGIAEFQVRFRAPSQKFYGMEKATGTGVTVTVKNRGTAPTAPVLTVTGNMPSGYTIQGPGGRLYQVTAGLPTGSVDVIDLATGLLLRDGSALTGAWGERVDVWTVPASGAVTQTLSPVSGSGQMTVEARPAYF